MTNYGNWQKMNLITNNFNAIRKINIGNMTIGGDTSFSFMSENNNKTKPFFGLEITYLPQNTLKTRFSEAQQSKADFISIKLNIENLSEIEQIKKDLTEIQKISKKPLIIRGSNTSEIDAELLPQVSDIMKKDTIIAFGNEVTYEKIVPAVVKNNQILVLRSPIDINIAKELNILSTDLGANPDRILIDPDMGGLGYGLDYGYSIIERIRQAGFNGDEMLNMPIIVFLGEEIFKAKEVKSDNFSDNWGSAADRLIHWELTAAVAIVSAGANIVVLNNAESVNLLKEVL